MYESNQDPTTPFLSQMNEWAEFNFITSFDLL